MGQGLSGSSKLIIAARGYSKEQSQIQADPIFGPYATAMNVSQREDLGADGIMANDNIPPLKNLRVSFPRYR